MNLDHAIDRLYALKVDTTTRDGDGTPHEKPHKPLLLLAACGWSVSLQAVPGASCSVFPNGFPHFHPHPVVPGTARPLHRALRTRPQAERPQQPRPSLPLPRGRRPLDRPRSRRQKPPSATKSASPTSARSSPASPTASKSSPPSPTPAAKCARRSSPATFLIFSPIHNPQSTIIDPPSAAVAEEASEYGRSPAFRRLILEIYDHQCAACGLRIRLPTGNDVSFIDAAHLLPWSEFRNDHPTNGLALCKNHHWAMDRDIIAPGPNLHWHVSKLIDPRRSNGERELAELSGKSLLLPKDRAFHPDAEGLKWRIKQLSA